MDRGVGVVLSKGIKVGLVGATPKMQKENYNSGDIENMLIQMYGELEDNTKNLKDMRGKTNLLELAGVCSEAKGVISVDAGFTTHSSSSRSPSNGHCR